MNLLDSLGIEKNDKMSNLDTININVIDNDMLYILSVLEKIDAVVGKTYGPRAGYVANEVLEGSKDVSLLQYTKDGLTTLANMNFLIHGDLIIANAVSRLTLEIKEKSGDGSTTAVKMLYNLVKRAASDIRNNIDKINMYRITAPKVIALVLKRIENIIRTNKIDVTKYEDIWNIGFIALNNDEELAKPLKELIEYLKENNIPINDKIELFATQSKTNSTKLITNPGYRMSVPNLVLNPYLNELENVKLVFIPNVIDLKFQIPLEELHKFAQSHAFKNSKGEKLKLVYVVSEIDNSLVEFYKHQAATVWKTDKMKLNYEFIEMDTVNRFTVFKREDLCALLNTQEFMLNNYIELRHDVPVYTDENGNRTAGDEFDNANNKMLWKIKAEVTQKVIGKDENGKEIISETRDHQKYRQEMFRVLSQLVSNSLECSLRKIGNSFSLIIADEVPKSDRLTQHIKMLEEVAASSDEAKAESAKTRLNNLSDNYFLIEVGSENVDNERLATAYKDATMSINSALRQGYHMGGSIGVIFAVIKALEELESEFGSRPFTNYEADIKNTEKYILLKLKEAYALTISDLLPDGMTLKEGLMDGYVNVNNLTFDNITVISPIETDIETIRGSLALFSSFFSSLAIEFVDPTTALHAKDVAKRVTDILDEREGKKISESTIKHIDDIPEEELSEEELEAKRNFKEAEKELQELMRRQVTGVAHNVRPFHDDPFMARQSESAVERVLSKYGTKDLGDGVTITGYGGEIGDLAKDVNRTREEQQRRKTEIEREINEKLASMGGTRYGQ